MRKRKGQSILEYVIVLTVIVAAIAVASTKIKSGVEKNLGDVQSTLEDASSRIKPNVPSTK